MTGRKQKKNTKTTDLSNHNGIGIPSDLTYEGYQKALTSLRRKNPAAARRLERFLEPILKERSIFPRRRIPWHKTSQGARLRLALLPQNPHVREDIEQIRQYLCIPKSHIHPSSKDSFWKEVSKRLEPEGIGDIRMVVEGNLVGEWLYIHRTVAAGNAISDKSPLAGLLSKPMIESAVASAGVKLTLRQAPEWVKRPPQIAKNKNTVISPVDWAAARIVERYQLPHHITPALICYLLTLNKAWVKDLELIEVEVEYGGKQDDDPGAFSIKMKNVDEFITASD